MRRHTSMLDRGLYTLAILAVSAATATPVSAQLPLPVDTLHATASRAVAGAAAATRSTDVLLRADIEALPARSVSEVIARALGVDLLARSAAQADVSIRGGSFEQVLVMVDGVPVNDDQTGHFHLDTAVPLDAVERIEVLRGPASALYGSAAVGGVINIVTRRGGRGFVARAQAGSFGSAAAGIEAGTSLGTFTSRIGIDHDRSDGHRAGTDHRATQARLALDGPFAGGALRGDVAYAMRDFGAANFYAPYDSYEETRATTAAISWVRAWSRVSIAPRVSVRQHEDDFILLRDDPAFYRNIHMTRQLAGEIVARVPLAARWRAAFGVEAVRSSLDSEALGDRIEHRTALFAEVATGTAATRLATAGLRLDHHSTFGTRLSPSLAASYRVTSAVRLRASAAAGFRAPSWTDRYYRDPANIGNPDLAAERFVTGEVGVAVEPAARVRVDAAAFIRRASDLIDWGRPGSAADDAPWRTLNVEDATFRGLETSLAFAVSEVTVTGRASLLSFDATATGGYMSKYALQPLTRSFSVEASRSMGPLAPALRLAHYRRANGSEWTLLDARLTTDVVGLQLFVDATNLLDADYRDISNLPAPRRAFHAGVRLKL